jgi:hypothetical protein
MAIENLSTFRFFNIPYPDSTICRSRNKDIVQVLKSPDTSVVTVESMEKSSRTGLVDIDSGVIGAGDNTIGIELKTGDDVSTVSLE